jgi:alcohol dehydrogenase class IV
MVRYNFPTTVHMGADVCKHLPEALKQAGVKHPLVVTDKALSALPVCVSFCAMLEAAHVKHGVFKGVEGNPVKSQVMQGVKVFLQGQHDGIVALGGGAALDVAKAIALMVYHPGDLFDYEDDLPGARPVDQKIPWVAALPTTAGTGSEVGRSAVISDDVTHAKKIIFSPRLMPNVVFADPLLTLALPPSVTASTGMDALTHLMEAYLAKNVQPLCDGIALEGMRYVAASLKACVDFAKRKEGATQEHVQARTDMLNAALMGAVAFQKGLGVVHSCAHALSTVCDMHHGLANGIMLPYGMRFNAGAVPHRFAEMGHVLGASSCDVKGVLAWIEQMKISVGVPRTLAEAGVKVEHFSKLVDVALADVCHANNPRVVTRADFEALFKEALGG